MLLMMKAYDGISDDYDCNVVINDDADDTGN
jgi:hypothetical protein